MSFAFANRFCFKMCVCLSVNLLAQQFGDSILNLYVLNFLDFLKYFLKYHYTNCVIHHVYLMNSISPLYLKVRINNINDKYKNGCYFSATLQILIRLPTDVYRLVVVFVYNTRQEKRMHAKLIWIIKTRWYLLHSITNKTHLFYHELNTNKHIFQWPD